MLSLEQVLNKMKSLEEINKKLVKENKQISDWMDNDSNTIEDLTAQLETAQKKIDSSEQVFMSSLTLFRLLMPCPFADTKFVLSILKYVQIFKVPYFREQFPRKLFFFEIGLMYCDLWLQYIKVRKLFKGGNYSSVETISGNTVCFRLFEISVR